MPDSPACLTGLVGLSRAASPCFPLPVAPADSTFITASVSGLYLDEVEGLHLRPAPNTAPGADAWARFDKSRSQAVSIVDNALRQRLSASAGPLLAPLVGKFGNLGDGSLVGLGIQPLMSFPTKLVPGRGYELVSLSLYASAHAEGVPVLLDGVELATVTVDPSAPVVVTLPPGTVIPFDGQVHTLTAVLPDGVRARSGKLTCGCGNHNPDVALALAGLQGGDCHQRYNQNAWSGGFIVHLQTTCINPDKLCYVLDTDEELQRSAAFAVQYKTAELTVVGLLAEAQYSRYTSLEPKALEGLIARYSALYAEHLDWLSGASGLSRVPQPCYGCAPNPLAYTKSR